MTSPHSPDDWLSTYRPARVRAGDAERENAATLLAEHYAQGRLDLAEFDRRSSRALAAVYTDELEVLLDDLPGASRQLLAAASSQRSSRRTGTFGLGPPVLILGLLMLVVLTRGAVLWLLPLMWWVAGSARTQRHPLLPSGPAFAAGPAAWRTAPTCSGRASPGR